MAEPISKSNFQNRYVQRAGNWAIRYISQSPRVSHVANTLGEKLFEAGSRLINRFGPETSIKPRDIRTICDILGAQKKTLYYKMQTDGTIVDISESVKGFLGITAEEVLEQRIKFDRQIRPDLKLGVSHAYNEGQRTGEIWGGVTKILDVSGKWHTIDTYLRTMYDEKGDVLSTVGIVFDVTEIRATEKELKIMLNAHESIMKIHEMISQQKDIDYILNEIVAAAKEVLPIDACAIKTPNEFGRLERRATAGLGDQYGKAVREEGQRTLSREAYDNGSIIGTNDIKAFSSTADKKYMSGLYAGLAFGEKKIGVMTMYRAEGSFTNEKKHVFTEEEIQADPNLKLIRLFLKLVSNAISNAELATLDGKTGLPTFRVCRERLVASIKLAMSKKFPISVLWPDIDKFKGVNTAFGETPHGDNVIREFAQILKKNERITDFAGKFGGDEFIDLLVGADHDSAEIAATRIMNAVNQAGIIVEADVSSEKIESGITDGLIYLGLSGENRHMIGLSASIGGVIIPADLFEKIDLARPEVLAQADKLAEKLADEALHLASLAAHRCKDMGRRTIVIDEGTSLFKIIEDLI